ncbi:4Fe-4S dicluster domain-containing protein [Thermococcus atlanticus]
MFKRIRELLGTEKKNTASPEIGGGGGLNVDACIGCGLCAQVCPFNAIFVMDNEKRVISFHPELCGECSYECNEICPTRAIEGRPDRANIEFDYAHCRVCGRKLDYTVKTADFLYHKLEKLYDRPEIVFMCDSCKHERIKELPGEYTRFFGGRVK